MPEAKEGMPPTISVVMPVYNAEKDLRQCLDSLLAQTLASFELICIDDGSTDGSPAILAEYAAKDPRITVLSQANAGAGAARNKGLLYARGEYLSILDCDDFYEPAMLELAYGKAAQADADIVVFRCDSFIEPEGRFEACDYSINAKLLPETQPFAGVDVPRDIFKLFVGWSWDKLFKRSFAEGLGLQFQEQRTTNDMLFVFSAIAKAERIVTMDNVLAHHRRGSGSLSVTREKSWHCFYDALCALRDQLLEWDLYNRFEQDYVNYCVHFSLWNLRTLAEPTHSMLATRLHNEWLASLHIIDFGRDYFYNKGEYAELLEQTARRPIEAASQTDPVATQGCELVDAALKTICARFHEEGRAAYDEARTYLTAGAGAALGDKDFKQPEDGLAAQLLRTRTFDEAADLCRPRLIASLTSFPARIEHVAQALDTVFSQTCPADEVVLWLAQEQFPGGETGLPFDLRRLIHDGKLALRWCDEDLRPHKKYIYAFEQYPDDLVITLDDDILYHPRSFEALLCSYLLFPESVSALRAHLALFDLEGQILPYNQWIMESGTKLRQPSMQLVATSGAGAIYPPHLLPAHVTSREAVKATCPDADDLWLKAAEAVAGIGVVIPVPYRGLSVIAQAQEESLASTNIDENGNDVQLAMIEAWCVEHGMPSIYEAASSFAGEEPCVASPSFARLASDEFALMRARLRSLNEEKKAEHRKLLKAYSERGAFEWKAGDLANRLSLVENSVSFKVGRKVTAPLRKLRDGLKRG